VLQLKSARGTTQTILALLCWSTPTEYILFFILYLRRCRRLRWNIPLGYII